MASQSGKKSKQTAVVNDLSIELATHFGTTCKFTAIDIRRHAVVEFQPGELRGALNYMRKSGLLNKCGTCKKTGHYQWMLTYRGVARAERASRRAEC